MRSGLITIAVALALIACSAKDKSTADASAESPAAAPAAAVATSSDDPTAEISSYSLDMDKMNKWMGVMKTVGPESKSEFNLGDDKTADTASVAWSQIRLRVPRSRQTEFRRAIS